jgi:hypothetical protein
LNELRGLRCAERSPRLRRPERGLLTRLDPEQSIRFEDSQRLRSSRVMRVDANQIHKVKGMLAPKSGPLSF